MFLFGIRKILRFFLFPAVFAVAFSSLVHPLFHSGAGCRGTASGLSSSSQDRNRNLPGWKSENPAHPLPPDLSQDCPLCAAHPVSDLLLFDDSETVFHADGETLLLVPPSPLPEDFIPHGGGARAPPSSPFFS